MSREERGDTTAISRERVYLRQRRNRGRDVHGNSMRRGVELTERVRERARTTADLRANRVRLELALTTDRELDQHGGNRSEDRHRDSRDGIRVLVVPAA